MPIAREQELWGRALWVEKQHGEDGRLYIAQQQDRLLAEGDLEGMAMWRDVALRFDQLREKKPGN
jgi:hypothetical protein